MGAGLVCMDLDRDVLLHRLTVAEGLPSEHISSLCIDRHGRLWVGTLGGGVTCVDRR